MLRARALALFVVVGALAFAGDARADSRFEPSFGVTLAQPAPQVASDFTLNVRIDQGEYQSAAVAFYIPRDWGVAPGQNLPVGGRVGTWSSVETFGFINSACNNPLLLEFELQNGTLDRSVQVSMRDTQMEQGDDSDTPGWGYPDFADDRDGNGLTDAVDKYPDFLVDTLGDAEPLARLASVPLIAGVPVLIQFVIFAPGARLDGELAQLPADAGQAGYLTVMMIDYYGARDGARLPSPITDHCAPLDASIRFLPADGGPSLFTNPQSGAYTFTFLAASSLDADSDGIENGFDTCPFVTNVGDPTALAGGDADQDGLDAACDPSDDVYTGGANSDEDGDGYLNRQDNCPLVSNGSLEYRPAPEDQSDPDGDQIGDACDPNPDSPDGEALAVTRTAEVVVGEASGSGGPPKVDACPLCYRPDGPASEGEEEGSGGQLAVALGLIAVGAGAGAVLVGSGAAYLIRRRRG
jgi:hypothetical protein